MGGYLFNTYSFFLKRKIHGIIDYGLKESIFIDVADLLTSGRSKCASINHGLSEIMKTLSNVSLFTDHSFAKGKL
jgi:hypothetical protein